MFKLIPLLCALLFSFPVYAEPAKKDIDCIPAEQASAYLKQSNMKLIVASIEGDIIKGIMKSPDDKLLIIIHIHQKSNVACLIDMLKNIELNISLKLLENA